MDALAKRNDALKMVLGFAGRRRRYYRRECCALGERELTRMTKKSHLAYAVAKGYVQSSLLIVSSWDRLQATNDTSFILAFHNLVGFAVELYLKSFLLHAGLSEDVLRSRKMGHKLSALLDAAKDNGFPQAGAQQIVDYVGPMHETFEYRYMQQGRSYTLMPLPWIFEKLSDLDNIVDAAVGASMAHNKQPGGRWDLGDRVSDWRIPK